MVTTTLDAQVIQKYSAWTDERTPSTSPNQERRTKNESTSNLNLMKIERFEDIEAWQIARELTKAIYQATRREMFAKDFGLKDQITRAAGSVMHNIAEGVDSGSNAEFLRFLRYSQRSCSEVQSQLYVAIDQDYIDNTIFDTLYDLASRAHGATGGFIKYLKNHGG